MGQLDQAAKELDLRLQDTEARLDRLRSMYEQFFQGIERTEPQQERKVIKKVVQELRTSSVRSTQLRFRINQIVSKLNTYETYWNRVTREIEEGTYQRDLFRARYHQRLRASQSQQSEEPKVDSPAPAEKASKAPRQQPAGISEDQISAIYDAYNTAKRRCKESVTGLTRDGLAATLRKQVPAIIKQYNCKGVEFKVVIKEGRAILKAIPKY
jgi:hypothetical protein